ncbi:ABC transporter permease [Aquibacillus rhizosphaerae]|uniref:ABC transporter permease n=1 Tax=Aquibacillus rhizosphaerae TaxID=3051431 RepID=A0ABT7LD93_9BACI|nr:ABC transporter permease [Aquibacillus sp. LR5S19]MDL4843155.1 ABC transporter permease [Aquibacillus sp. LR5S19]
MNFFKRAILSITRKKGKSIILLAVIFILGNLISGAISIQQATGNVETTIKEKLGTAATVELDYEAIEKMDESEMMELEIEELDLELIKQIGELSYVKYYDFSTSTYLGSETIKSYQGEGMEEEEVMYEGPSMDFMLKGINHAPIIDLEEEKGKLVDGRVFTPEEVENGAPVAVISKKLAELNNLHVGDNFTLINEVYSFDESNGEDKLVTSRDLVLEVIGLFEPKAVKNDAEESEEGMYDFMDIEYQNTIYVANEVVSSEMRYNMEEYMKVDEEMAAAMGEEEITDYYTPLFVLNKPEDTEAFEEEVQPLLPQYYKVTNASDQYDSIAAPVESMSKLSGYVLLVAVIATILIIGLVVLLFLRDRKRELGIYLSLGERRSRVVGQIVIEVMIVAVIGISLSLFSGNLLAQSVSDTMIDAEAEKQNSEEEMYYSELQTDVTTDDVLESYKVELDPGYVGIFYLVGLLTILVSTIIPLIYIVRLNPKKIMM